MLLLEKKTLVILNPKVDGYENEILYLEKKCKRHYPLLFNIQITAKEQPLVPLHRPTQTQQVKICQQPKT